MNNYVPGPPQYASTGYLDPVMYQQKVKDYLLYGWLDQISRAPVDPKKASMLQSIKPVDTVIYGWRGYHITYDDNGLVLKGSRNAWVDASFHAKCYSDHERAAVHIAQRECECGVYGFTDRTSSEVVHGDVVALCLAYGWVAPYTLGWRAEYARIERIFWTPKPGQIGVEQIKELLELRYGVEVEIGEAH